MSTTSSDSPVYSNKCCSACSNFQASSVALVEEGHHNYCINDYCINYSIIVFHNKLREFKYFDLDYIRAVMLIREVGGGGTFSIKGCP